MVDRFDATMTAAYSPILVVLQKPTVAMSDNWFPGSVICWNQMNGRIFHHTYTRIQVA